MYEWGEPTHAGIDIQAPIGTRVTSSSRGQVVFVGPYKKEDRDGSPGLGLIALGSGNVLYGYWHLSAVEVSDGEYVTVGQTLGYSGNSGFEGHPDWAPHLHFEMWLLTHRRRKFRLLRGVDYDDHLKYLWVPAGGMCINPFPYLREWYDDQRPD